MFAMMTMHKERSSFGRKFGQFRDAIGWDAVVAVGQVNVTQAVAAGPFNSGLAAVHTDKGFHAEFCNGSKRGIVLGLRTGINICGGAKGIMHAGNFNWLRGRTSRQHHCGISNRRHTDRAAEKCDEEKPSPEANINMI